MFAKKQNTEDSKFDEVVDGLLSTMLTTDENSEMYTASLGNLERIVGLRQSKERRKVSPDTIALVAGNLLGILVIVAYEQKHVMTSKGLNFIMKPK